MIVYYDVPIPVVNYGFNRALRDLYVMRDLDDAFNRLFGEGWWADCWLSSDHPTRLRELGYED